MVEYEACNSHCEYHYGTQSKELEHSVKKLPINHMYVQAFLQACRQTDIHRHSQMHTPADIVSWDFASYFFLGRSMVI